MRSLAIVLAFSSVSAFAACPNLAGTYATCRSTTGSMDGSTDLVITQKTVNRITTYTMTSTNDRTQERETEEIVADGKTRSETQNDPEFGDVVASVTFSCSGPKMTGNVSISMNGGSIFDYSQEVQKKGSTLEIDYFGTLVGMPFQDTVICE